VRLRGSVAKRCLCVVFDERPRPPPPPGALVMPLMTQGLLTGLIKFNLMTCTKPL
jgi:hypothetical protein